jgi:polar amino acid transport system permease protein
MAIEQATLPRDEMAEAEVRRIERVQSSFVIQTALTWVGIFILLGLFLSFIHFDTSFLFKVCVGSGCAVEEKMPGDVIRLGGLVITWSGWLLFILTGIGITLFVSVVSIALAVLIAFIGALGRLSKNPLFFGPATFYTSIFRGTPLLVQVFFWYLALPQVRIPGIFPDGIVLDPMAAGIFALAVCYGAYMMETFRAGIQSISKGQTEAAVALGMTSSQTLRRIILPQAIRIVIPPIGNEFIAMTKDSALVKFMGVWELFFRADKIGRQYFRNFETLLVAALVYWILTIILQFFQSKVETRLSRGDR